MPPRITKVRWSAQNLPWGISFNEKTGTFTGSPEDVGEYTVPVTVETNYGKDTEDVKIIVIPPVYSVYAIGAKAATWSGNADPDEDGFYGLSMPKAYELRAHYEGFGALTAGRKYYCCGYYERLARQTIELKQATTPIYLPNCDRVIFVRYSYYISTGGTLSRKTTSEVGNSLLLWDSRIAAGRTISSDLKKTVTVYSQGKSVTETIWTSDNNYIGYNFSTSSIASGMQALGDSPYVQFPLRYILADNTKINTSTVIDLGYTAIKIFQSNPAFDCLSENYYLDNNPDNFTHGLIKDAWCYGAAAYVQTTNNQLYQYVSSSKTWDLLGTFDIKKVEIPNINLVFLLTNNGELYHKGNAVSGITEAHDSFTHIFTNLNFADFTFGGNTLTVLKE